MPDLLCSNQGGEGGETFYTEWEESFESFDQMNLHENLLRGIYAYGTCRAADHRQIVSVASPAKLRL